MGCPPTSSVTVPFLHQVGSRVTVPVRVFIIIFHDARALLQVPHSWLEGRILSGRLWPLTAESGSGRLGPRAEDGAGGTRDVPPPAAEGAGSIHCPKFHRSPLWLIPPSPRPGVHCSVVCHCGLLFPKCPVSGVILYVALRSGLFHSARCFRGSSASLCLGVRSFCCPLCACATVCPFARRKTFRVFTVWGYYE